MSSFHPVCTVHGFAYASYDVEEGNRLETIFEVNVKGETNLTILSLSGIISSAAGPNTSKCLLCLLHGNTFILFILGTTDFEALPAITVKNNRADIQLFTNNDDITVEYDDTVLLTFTPDPPSFPAPDIAGEFLRDRATH